MSIDPENPVAQLCARGMEVDGDPAAASALFAQAWAARRDDYDAAIAAHFVARHQPTPEATLHWNALAVEHAERVGDDRVTDLMPSLYLNLGDSYRLVGNVEQAEQAAARALALLETLPVGGYRDFVEFGVRRLIERLRGAEQPTSRAERSELLEKGSNQKI
jgi:hypothetical protein